MSSEAKEQGATSSGERQPGGGRQKSSEGGTRSSLSSAVLKHQLQQAAKEAEEEGGASRRTSFLAIQQEQARDAERKRQGSNSRLPAASRDDVDFFGRPLPNQDDDGERGSHNNRRREGSFRRGDSFGGNSRSDSYRRRSSSLNMADLKLERGRVATKLEKFGFIYCADRPSELFFHYSEFRGSNIEDLKVGDEVEFRVGPSSRRGGSDEADDGEEKMAAYAVKPLETGTVVWEVPEDDPGVRRKGRVQRVARDDSRQGKSNNNKDPQEGTIRPITDDSAGDDADVESDEASKNLIRYVSADYTASAKSEGGRAFDRLGKSDLVEFKLVTEKRTGRKFAREITLLQSERERLRQEREEKLMETAILEQGIVSNLKEDYGFLRSNKRKHQEVYFHFSNVLGAAAGDDAVVDESHKGNVDHWKKELTIGQEVEFLVVKEEQTDGRGGGGKGGRGPPEKLSARQLKLLPKGTVLFHQVVANAVEGTIVDCPGPPAPDRNAGRDGFRRDGKVKLISPLSHSASGNNTVDITEVWFETESLPATNSVAVGAATKTEGGGTRHFLWLRPGDRVLFDVVLSLADEKYWAVPTKAVGPASGQKGGDKANSEKNTEARIRLVEPYVGGRCEGVVRALHDNYGYGFIRSAERNVDVYFRMQDVFPPEIMTDLALSVGEAKKDLHYYRKPISKNMEVSFDLSLQGTVQSGGNHGGGGGRTGRNQKQGERENLIGHRVAILPKGSVLQNKVLAAEVKAKVSQDGKHIEVEEGIVCMDMREKHPMVAKLIDSVLGSPVDSSVLLPDVQSDHEYRVIRSMVDAEDGLEWSYVSVAASSHGKSHPGKIKITRVEKGGKDTNETNETAEEETTPTDLPAVAEGDVEGAPKKGRKKKKGPQTVKVIRIEKQSLSSVEGAALKEGDVVTCEVLQSRRSSDVYANVISVVERKVVDSSVDGDMPADGGEQPKELPTKGVGIVVDLLTNRQFGFISRIDEHSPKREHLFFHMSSLLEQGGGSKDGASPGQPPVKKSDEVSFDISLGKNGKRVAENIKILPKGTLSLGSKGSKHSCQGYLLLEPSHTTLDTTPKKKSGMRSRSKSPVGRWGLVGTEKEDSGIPESTVNEGGCILLLSDPKNIFGERTRRPFTEDSPKDASSDSLADEKKEAGAPEENNENEAKQDDGIGAKEDEAADKIVDGEKAKCAEENEEKEDETKDGDEAEKPESEKAVEDVKSAVGSYLGYKQNNETGKRGGVEFEVSEPRRGDLVSFVKGKTAKTAKDLHVIAHNAATKVLGQLENINVDEGTATFVPSTPGYENQEIELVDVVSCKPKMLKDKEPVEAILYEGRMRGIARTIDLYLESKVEKLSQKERPKLNLAMKSDRPRGPGTKGAGHVIMAKGPDGTNGFQKGWCQRKSKFAKGGEETKTGKTQEATKENGD